MKPKRYRTPRQIPDTLQAQWGKLPGEREDVIYSWAGRARKCDAGMLNGIFTSEQKTWDNKVAPSFLEELTRRGYDITTLKFSIKKLPEPSALPPPPSIPYFKPSNPNISGEPSDALVRKDREEWDARLDPPIK